MLNFKCQLEIYVEIWHGINEPRIMGKYQDSRYRLGTQWYKHCLGKKWDG